MTKQIKLSGLNGIKINETECVLLRYVAGKPGALSVEGLKSMAAATGIKPATLQRTLHSCVSKDLLIVRARFMPNGGQIENEYQVANLGLRVIDLLSQREKEAKEAASVG